MPLLISKIMTSAFHVADAIHVESWEKATAPTVSPLPSSVCRHSPLLVSQILISNDADASSAELWERAIVSTLRPWLLGICGDSLLLTLLLTLQILTVLSSDTDASHAES